MYDIYGTVKTLNTDWVIVGSEELLNFLCVIMVFNFEKIFKKNFRLPTAIFIDRMNLKRKFVCKHWLDISKICAST